VAPKGLEGRPYYIETQGGAGPEELRSPMPANATNNRAKRGNERTVPAFHYGSPATAKLSQSHREIQARSLKTRVILLQPLKRTTPSRMPLNKTLALPFER